MGVVLGTDSDAGPTAGLADGNLSAALPSRPFVDAMWVGL